MKTAKKPHPTKLSIELPIEDMKLLVDKAKYHGFTTTSGYVKYLTTQFLRNEENNEKN